MKAYVRIVAVPIKKNINLALLASSMGIKGFENWRGCLELDVQSVASILRYTVENACVLLYKMGCIVIIGLNEKEEQTILSRLKLFLEIDYLKHMYLFKDYDYCPVAQRHTKAEAMARSVRLRWIEIQVDELVEQAEPLLIKINKGSKRGFTPKFRYLIAKIQRFEIESAGILAMLGRTYQGISKETYEAYMEDYNIKERLMIVNEKLELLKSITSIHELFGRFIGWQRLLAIEAVLLICFPIPGLISLDMVALGQRVLLLINTFFK
ncbi:RMD1 family protein [Cellulosilyticum sp. I15G10I2]|uniref:RMD1 family protein n=1 Tax=Cellulosilyticum sp. I15G10I2 TaxID=1892843 RepID=UPI00085BC826|nr:RMD1 family protein [Cellulosilyticum sp. I15G10I2]